MQGLAASFAVSRRPRWADMLDSSQEAGFEEPASAPFADDSYRGAPAADLESSKAGLNKRLKTSAALEEPKDFAFLFKRPLDSEASGPSETGWQSPAEVLVGNLQRVDMDTPPPGGTTTRNGSSASTSAKSRPRHKRQVSTASRAAGKRVRSPPEARSDEAAAPALQAVASTAQVADDPLDVEGTEAQQVLQTLPPASEEDWQHREEKRRRALMIVKASDEYQAYSTAKCSSPRKECEPQTPDASDRLISKRRWEQEVQQWRAGLRTWCVDRQGLTAASGKQTEVQMLTGIADV